MGINDITSLDFKGISQNYIKKQLLSHRTRF